MKNLFLLLSVPYILFAQTNTTDKTYKMGEDIYQQTCVSCHGETGNTNPEMKLVVKPRKLSKTILTKEQSFEIIKEGARYWGAHSDIMPAFKYVYSDEQIEAVSVYITEKFNHDRDEKIKKLLDESEKVELADEKMLKTGKKIFKRNCSLCHGVTGNGESVYVEQSKQNNQFIYPYNLQRTLLNEDQVFLYAKYGGHFWGTDKTDMPSWKKKYNDTKLKSVARYIELKIKNMNEK